MIDTDKLRPILEGYKANFSQVWEDENYKRKAVQHFQNHWDINAPNFGLMFKEATKKTGNLFDTSPATPRAMILKFAKADDEAVRQMFRSLFDESRKLEDRVTAFMSDSDKIRSKYDDGTWKNHYQSTNPISTYLWLRYPDKYFIYKYSIYYSVAKELGTDYHPKTTDVISDMIGGYHLYDELCSFIAKDSEISDLVKNAMTDGCYPDTKMIMTTMDFGYYLHKYYVEEKKKNVEASQSDVPLVDESSQAIWKISEGTDSTGVSTGNKQIFLSRQVVVVDSLTSAKGISKKAQGQEFMESIKKGDYFYLCFGSSIQFLGQFTGDNPIENPEFKNGWYERSYKVIAQSSDSTPYEGTKKWWTPNENSTCIRVGESDYSLFEELILQPYFGMTVAELFRKDASSEEKTEIQRDSAIPAYTKEDFLKQVYMSERKYNELEALLKNKQNIILQGAPGVGKTFAARKLAYAIMGEADDSRIEFVQFHQNYTYEDFVMGYRPDGTGFILTAGVFYGFCQTASSHPDKEYFFIIDEINRGNLSKILGELMMLIEKEYRGTEITLAYNGQPFAVPKNLYIIGMMNTADRSLALIDYALRRRFSFFEMIPGFDSEGFRKYQKSLDNETFNELIIQVKDLNKVISKDSSLGRGFSIGHSYFCGRENSSCTEEWMRQVVEYDILPMLSEYWFDEPEKYQNWQERLCGVFDDE